MDSRLKVRVSIIEAGHWILRDIAENLVTTYEKEGGPVEYARKGKADLFFYVDADAIGEYGNHPAIGLFTHPHRGSFDSVAPQALRNDYLVHMSRVYYQMFLDHGISAEKMFLEPLPIHVEKYSLRKTVLGIFGRGKYPGQGFDFMLELLDSDFDFSDFSFLVAGIWWDEVVAKMRAKGISVEHHPEENVADYPLLYQKVDYMFNPRLYSAGPLALMEAKAMGIPVISSLSGIALEYPLEHSFKPGDIRGCLDILSRIRAEKVARRDQVKDLTWKNYLRRMDEVFLRIAKREHLKGFETDN